MPAPPETAEDARARADDAIAEARRLAVRAEEWTRDDPHNANLLMGAANVEATLSLTFATLATTLPGDPRPSTALLGDPPTPDHTRGHPFDRKSRQW